MSVALLDHGEIVPGRGMMTIEPSSPHSTRPPVAGKPPGALDPAAAEGPESPLPVRSWRTQGPDPAC